MHGQDGEGEGEGLGLLLADIIIMLQSLRNVFSVMMIYCNIIIMSTSNTTFPLAIPYIFNLQTVHRHVCCLYCVQGSQASFI